MKKEVLHEKHRFKSYLNKTGLKLTSGRQQVFEEVMVVHGHFAPEELVKHCKSNNRKVSRATIYRCLKELLEAGIIRETAFGDKHQHFEHVYDEKLHHHAKCVRCSKYIEIPDLGEDKIYRSILKDKGFKILGHEMHFNGICKECQEKERKQ